MRSLVVEQNKERGYASVIHSKLFQREILDPWRRRAVKAVIKNHVIFASDVAKK